MFKKNLIILIIGYISLTFAYEKHLWPEDKIAYEISNDIDAKIRHKIKSTLKDIQLQLQVGPQLCIEFIEKTNETDYIKFKNGLECSTEIGHLEGENEIILNKNCLSDDVLVRQIVHKLGFNYEHLRSDRDEHVDIDMNNIEDEYKRFFELRSSQKEQIESSPYDYFSILHYTSNQYQKNNKIPVIKTKHYSLINKNLLINDRPTMSKLDIHKIQLEYGCRQAKLPSINYEYDMDDSNLRELIEKRFVIETNFKRFDKQLVKDYLNKTFETCGMNHYWPFDYPLVTVRNKFYQYYCLEKKNTYDKCLYSIECGPKDDAVCVRFFYKKTGRCVKLGSVGNKINDGFFKLGKDVKDIFG